MKLLSLPSPNGFRNALSFITAASLMQGVVSRSGGIKSAIVVFSKRGKIGESDHFYQIGERPRVHVLG